MNMPRWINILTQSLLLVCQIINQFFEIIPAKYKTAALIAMAMVQGVVAIIAHSYNPDGTNAALPWTDPKVIATARPLRPGGAGAIFMFALLISLVAGCALTQAVDKLEGEELLKLVKQENSQGCVSAWINGAHLGVAGAMRVIATWGKTPPDVRLCTGQVTTP
jgi:hypothetical protein